jgi:2-polyprenyl-6-methoxyphenol hydroxylase-like FAD-dependent oxidoreductase
MIIQVLYDNLPDKSKVLTNKGVSEVRQSTSRVEVVTADGETYHGDILVGADGIHSTVREEMWRLADQETPGYFPVSDRSIPTEYCCIFGISRPSEKFPKCSTQNVQGRNYSYLVLTGPDHRIYWFLFKKLPVTAYGKIPRYTKDQEDALVAEHASNRITDTLTFGELYALRKTSTLQALPEVVFSKWHYNRIMTIGDAAHKVSLADSREDQQADISCSSTLSAAMAETAQSKTLLSSQTNSTLFSTIKTEASPTQTLSRPFKKPKASVLTAQPIS